MSSRVAPNAEAGRISVVHLSHPRGHREETALFAKAVQSGLRARSKTLPFASPHERTVSARLLQISASLIVENLISIPTSKRAISLTLDVNNSIDKGHIDN